ncbi:MAG: hypothetical protein E4G91_07085 [Candidatus Zixiibacteriota bacterium]|nr:MAG: hypothetical protein E4G91_07085 [candidate division Zixibacteria bacterium]
MLTAETRILPLCFAAILLLSVTLVAEGTNQPATRQSQTPPHGTMAISCDSIATAGNEFVVDLIFSDTTMPVAGFNLNIEYDRGVLVFDSATLGSLTAGEWEYFSSRSGLIDRSDSGSAAGFIRLVALADQPDAENKAPKPRSLVGPGELVRIYFYVSERKEYQGRPTFLRFIWTKCDDNSFSDRKGIKLYVSRDVYDATGKRLTNGVDKYAGAANNCFSSRRNAPVRVFDFRSAAVMIR